MWSFRAKNELVHLVPWRWRGKIFVTKEPQAGGVSSTWVSLVLWNIFSCFFVPFLRILIPQKWLFPGHKNTPARRVFSTLPLEGLWGVFLPKKICERVGKPNNRSTTSRGSCDFWCFSVSWWGPQRVVCKYDGFIDIHYICIYIYTYIYYCI